MRDAIHFHVGHLLCRVLNRHGGVCAGDPACPAYLRRLAAAREG